MKRLMELNHKETARPYPTWDGKPAQYSSLTLTVRPFSELELRMEGVPYRELAALFSGSDEMSSKVL